MALVTTKRNVDVLPGQAAPTVFHCSQHDVGATIILGLVNAGGNYSIPSGVTAIIQGSCSNGAVFTPVTAAVSGSDITFNLSAEMTSIAGPTVCEAVLSKDTDILGTANFVLDVEPSAMGSDTPSVFADAAWLWMVDKMGSETVSALGDKTVIDAINGKADQSDVTALSDAKLDKNQGTANAGKYLKVGADGNVETADLDVTTDKTLSIADKAADAKAVGDELDDLKADLNEYNDIVGIGFVSESDFVPNKGISASNGAMYDNTSGGSASNYIDISGMSSITYARLQFSSSNPNTGGMAFYDSSKTYISGVPRIDDPAESTVPYSVDVPENAKYARFSYWTISQSVIPFFAMETSEYRRSYNRRITDIKNTANASAVSVEYVDGVRFGSTKGKEPTWTANRCINVEGTDPVGAMVTANADLKASDYIDVCGNNSLFITMARTGLTTPPIWGVCFYDKDKNALERYGTNGLYNRVGDAYVETVEVFVPHGAVYFRTTFWSDTFISDHEITTEFNYYFTEGNYDDITITQDIPANRGILNAVRRARQLTDVKWTPLVDVPKYSLANGNYSGESDKHFLDWCKSGKEYTGIPYSGSGRGENWTYGRIDPNCDAGKWGYYMFFVGLDVDMETFITASRYPNSIFGERANRQTYNYDGSIYGDVCTALLSYALGLKSPIWPVRSFMTGASYGKNYFRKLGDIPTIDTSIVRIGDALHNSGHVAIITDIRRDAEGNAVAFEVCEATTAGNPSNGTPIGTNLGGKCRRKSWPIELFRYWFQTYTLWRYKSFTGMSYQPTPYVNTGDELDEMPPVDLPCIPYLGNKARYKTGHILNTKILIGATGYTTLTVNKDGELFGTFTLDGSTEIEVGFSEVGSYEAYLTDANNMKSYSCTWTVEEFTN